MLVVAMLVVMVVPVSMGGDGDSIHGVALQ